MKIGNVILWLIVAFAFVAVLTHAVGFSTAAGSLFTGTNMLGKTLEGQGVASGGQKVA